MNLFDAFSIATTAIERLLFTEYGAIFATQATPPPVILFADEDQVRQFQFRLDTSKFRLGDLILELQSVAVDSLLEAVDDASRQGFSITPRAVDAARRSYSETVSLWRRNVERGLDHWCSLGRLSSIEAKYILELNISDQVAAILQQEERKAIYFGTYFDKSILSSVAAPGSSQHLSMLAFDVLENDDEHTERLLGLHGWFRTVPGDLPHFTYLGLTSDMLAGACLMLKTLTHSNKVFRFWVPDIKRLEKSKTIHDE